MGSSTKIHKRLLRILREYPEGISIGQIRLELQLRPEEQQHLDRRIRDLDGAYLIERERSGGETLYVLRGKRAVPRARPSIPPRLRGEVLLRAAGSCAMCGRTVERDGVTLEVDHIVPVEWAGETELGNLQALCREDNAAKKAYFAGFDPETMKRVYALPRVHQRIGELLTSMHPKYVPGFLLGAVAGQEDWQKRLRELRVLGWRIDVRKGKVEGGRIASSYRAVTWSELPEDPSKEIRRLEAHKGKRK